jgi:hypothetical protein
MLSDTGEFVGLILDLASRLHALEIFHPPVAGGVSGFGVRELELRLARVERDLTDQKPSPTLHLIGKVSLSRLCWIACPVWKPPQWKTLVPLRAFNSFGDCRSWLASKKAPGSIDYLGHWVDPLSMSSIAEAQTRDANVKLVHKSMLAKAHFSSGSNEASVLFSFSDVLPLLVGSSHLVVDAKFMLPKVKKFSDWYSEGHIDGISVYSRWSKACSGYSSSLVRELDRRWNRLDQAELRAVGLDFSMRTKAFIDELNTFVKEFRTELLIEEDGADDEEAWSLFTAMMSAIFKTMSAAQARRATSQKTIPTWTRAQQRCSGVRGSAIVLWRSYSRSAFANIRACSLL